jgi:hypothetical protein
MRYVFILLLSFSLIACNQAEDKEPAAKPVNVAAIEFATNEIALVGSAQSMASNWEEYSKFETALENYDHSEEATGRLATSVKVMRQNIDPNFDNQPIRSRLLVLESRIRSYQSFLKVKSKTAVQYKEYFNSIMVALDNFRGQLNEKLVADEQMKELIEELKGDLRNLNATETDSIP